jgi:hypothetical protein
MMRREDFSRASEFDASERFYRNLDDEKGGF